MVFSCLSIISIYSYFYLSQFGLDFFALLDIKKLILGLLCLLILLFAVLKNKDRVLSSPRSWIIAAIVISTILVISKNCSAYGGLSFSFQSIFGIIYSIYCFIVFVLISLYSFAVIEKLVNSIEVHNNTSNRKAKKVFLVVFLIVLAFWVPYAIIRYPAGVESDAFNQISQVYGYSELNNRWPLFSTLFMGNLVKLFHYISGSFEFGEFLYVLFQTIICAFIFSYSAYVLYKNGIGIKYISIYTLIISISPIFAGYITSIVKDTMFSVFCLLYVCELYDMLHSEKCSLLRMLAFLITSLLMCLFRNNGIYVVYLFIIVLLLARIKYRKYILICLLICSITYSAYNRYIFNYLHFHNYGSQEALSFPFQQTARYLVYYPNDITKEELEIVDSVLDVETIKEKYDPLLSDDVKSTYHAETSKELKEYFILWVKMFFRHPFVYVDSTLMNSHGFFLPSARMRYSYLNSGLYSAPDSLKQYAYFFENNILTFYLCNVGIANLATIALAIICLFENKKETIFLLGMPLITILVCIASPTFWQNGFRYALPVVYSLLFIFGVYTLETKRINETSTNK